MLYVTLTFWLLVAVFTAWGVHSLWSSMLKPRTVNSVLLPGTLAAQLGHVLGLLVTGATITNTTLYKDDDSGEPEMTQDPKPRIPIVGPVLIGMLPILACAVGIFFVIRFLGGTIVEQVQANTVARLLPTTLAGGWDLLRDQITLIEKTVDAARIADWGRWEVWLFAYLMVCLTVRMAPFPGTLRGTLGATVVLGILAGLTVSLGSPTEASLDTGWMVLTLAVTSLLLLLIVSLLVRGGVSLFRLLASEK